MSERKCLDCERVNGRCADCQQHPFGSVCPHGVQMLDECEECK